MGLSELHRVESKAVLIRMRKAFAALAVVVTLEALRSET